MNVFNMESFMIDRNVRAKKEGTFRTGKAQKTFFLYCFCYF